MHLSVVILLIGCSMAKIWMFDLEGLLKHGVIKKDHEDGCFAVYSKQERFIAFIYKDILITGVVQLKLNSKDMEVLRKYTENL